MKQFWLLVAVFVSFDSLWSQEVKQALTVEQCRADQKLWFSKISDDAKAEEVEGLREPVAHSISFQQLTFLTLEMHDCARIDPEFKKEFRRLLRGKANSATWLRDPTRNGCRRELQTCNESRYEKVA